MTPQLDLVGVIVADMGRSLAFYRRLGLDIPAEADEAPHVEIALPGGMRLAFDTEATVRSFDPQWQRPAKGHSIGLAFLCDGPEAVDATYEQLVAAGYAGHLKPWDAFWGQRYAVVNDPDGNPIDLFAPSA
jgi:catechol 2,3-dioxygenase-like lactoylglutathione lyase family enzyme